MYSDWDHFEYDHRPEPPRWWTLRARWAMMSNSHRTNVVLYALSAVSLVLLLAELVVGEDSPRLDVASQVTPSSTTSTSEAARTTTSSSSTTSITTSSTLAGPSPAEPRPRSTPARQPAQPSGGAPAPTGDAPADTPTPSPAPTDPPPATTAPPGTPAPTTAPPAPSPTTTSPPPTTAPTVPDEQPDVELDPQTCPFVPETWRDQVGC